MVGNIQVARNTVGNISHMCRHGLMSKKEGKSGHWNRRGFFERSTRWHDRNTSALWCIEITLFFLCRHTNRLWSDRLCVRRNQKARTGYRRRVLYGDDRTWWLAASSPPPRHFQMHCKGKSTQKIGNGSFVYWWSSSMITKRCRRAITFDITLTIFEIPSHFFSFKRAGLVWWKKSMDFNCPDYDRDVWSKCRPAIENAQGGVEGVSTQSAP